MSKNKYYAVRVGREPGIYESWDECSAQVNGFKGAEYKSFKTRDEAEIYLNNKTTDNNEDKKADSNNDELVDYDQLVIDDLNNSRVVAFVDGSFSDKGGEPLAGFGCYILPSSNSQPVEISDKVHSKKFIETRNIAPEIFATLEALKWAVANGHKAITIYHDLEHTGKWARKEYRASTEIAKLFIRELEEKFNNVIDIKYTWVKSHSGIEYNEKADQLASNAIKNQRKPVAKYGNNFFTGRNVSEEEVNKIIKELKEFDNVHSFDEELTNGGKKYTFEKVMDGKRQEKLTVIFYPKDKTTLLQGKVESLFSIFLSRYTIHLPDFEMIRAYSDSYRTTIKNQSIDGKIAELNLPKNYPISSITLLKQSFVMLDIAKNERREEYDYTHYVLPVYRALEGHLKYLFEESGVHLSERDAGGGHFDKDATTGLFYLKTTKLKSHPNAKKLEITYNLYCNNRHSASHFGEIIGNTDTTLLINNSDDAIDRIQEVLQEIRF